MTKAVLFVRLGQIMDTNVQRSILEFDKLFKEFKITMDWENPSLFAAVYPLFEKFNTGGYYASESVIKMAKAIQQRNKHHSRAPAIDLDALAEKAFASELFAVLETRIPTGTPEVQINQLRDVWHRGRWLQAWNEQCHIDANSFALAASISAINADPKSRISIMIIGGTNSAHQRKFVLSLLDTEDEDARVDLTNVTTLYTYNTRNTVPGMLAKFLDVNAGKYAFFQIPGNPELVQHPAFITVARENERQIQAVTTAHGVTNLPIEGKLTPAILAGIIQQISTDPRLNANGNSPAFTDMTAYPRPSMQDFGM